jgi:hypothetical protein
VKIVALLSFYDENPDWLTECVTRVADLADHVIAVEGRYHDFPTERMWNREDQAEAILRADVPVTLHLQREPWPTEVAKREFLFRLAAPIGADWLFRLDADEFITNVPADLRERLVHTTRDVAEVYLNESPPGTPGPLRALFRALPGIRITHAHNLVTAPVDDRWLVLAGEHSIYQLEPAEQLHDIQVDHRRLQRPRARQEQKDTYYRLMPQLETRWTPVHIQPRAVTSSSTGHPSCFIEPRRASDGTSRSASGPAQESAEVDLSASPGDRREGPVAGHADDEFR